MNRNEASWVSLCLGVTALAGLLAPAVAAATTVDLLTETEARARAAQVSDVSEDVTLTFTAGSRSFGGAAVLRFRLAGTGSALRLDFKGPAPKRLSVNGANLELPDHDGNRLLLPAAALRIGPNVVEVGYENPYDTSGVGVCHIVDPADGREYVYTDFEPFNAHRLLPCFDQPDLKARFRVTIEAPADWVAVANGPESARAPASGGAVAHRFEPTPSLSTYLLFVGAGPYAVFSDPHCAVPSRLFARQSMKGHVDTRELFELIRHGLDFYREYFGMAYPFAKYDQLFLPEFNTSAMENPGAVTFNERFLFRHAPTTKERMERAEIVLHEMAHMWFGNLVTMRWWDGLWLNESFATYVGNLALARATRYKDAFEEFLTVQKSEAYRKDQLPTTHPVAGTVADTNAAFDSFDDITYGKGASLLKQLAFYVGPETFRRGVQQYFRDHAWKNTESADFLTALGKEAGLELEQWSRLQLETAGVNELVPVLEVAGGKLLSLVLEQRPGSGQRALRPHRLQLALYRTDARGSLAPSRIVTVKLDGARTAVAGLAGEPAPAFVWANHGDHAYARVMLDPVSLTVARESLDRIEHGLTRRGVWMTLWEMVRERGLSPRDYIAAVKRHGPREPDPKILEGLLDNVGRALTRYVGADRDRLREELHSWAWAHLERAPAGSDAQKTWFDFARNTASSPDALGRLESLLDGKPTLSGLELDPERRWGLIARLGMHHRPGAPSRISNELTRDPTDLGRRLSLAARTAIPEPAAKEAAWRVFTTGTDRSLDFLRAALRNFHSTQFVELSRPYVARYFEAIPALRRDRDQEFAAGLARELFPGNLVEEGVVRQARAFLESHRDLPADTLNPIRDELDELERAAAIRERWK